MILSTLLALACSPEVREELPPSRVEPNAEPAPARPPPGPRGHVELPLDGEELVKKTVRRYAGQVKYCYEMRLKTSPDLSGRLEVSWSIDANGRVENARVADGTTADDELAACVVAKLKRWRFPKDAEGEVTWPFVFKPTAAPESPNPDDGR